MSHAQNLPVFLTSMLDTALLKVPTESNRRYLRGSSPCKTSLTSDVSVCKQIQPITYTLQRSETSLCAATLTHTVQYLPKISRSKCSSTCSFKLLCIWSSPQSMVNDLYSELNAKAVVPLIPTNHTSIWNLDLWMLWLQNARKTYSGELQTPWL